MFDVFLAKEFWQTVFKSTIVLAVLYLLFAFRKAITKDLKRLCSERTWQLWSRIWLHATIFIILVITTFCFCIFGNEYTIKSFTGVSPVLAALLTSLGTYIVNEWNDWNRRNEDENVMIESLLEELQDFSKSSLEEMKEMINLNLKYRNSGGYTPSYAAKYSLTFPCYDNYSSKIAKIKSSNVKKYVKQLYQRIFGLFKELSRLDETANECREKYLQEKEKGFFAVGAKEIYNDEVNVLISFQEEKLEELCKIQSGIINMAAMVNRYVQ